MAKTSTPDLMDALDSEWQTVSTGIGNEWPITDEPLVGNYIGTTSKDLVDDDGEMRNQAVHQFAPKNSPDEVAFLWGSYELDTALAKVEQGSLVKITFTGFGQFKSKSGPRQIKHYRVQVAK